MVVLICISVVMRDVEMWGKNMDSGLGSQAGGTQNLNLLHVHEPHCHHLQNGNCTCYLLGGSED